MHTTIQLQKLFIDYLQKQTFQAQPQELYDPINYIMTIGGKRLRPVMLLMSYNLFKDKVEEALPGAYSIEIFHNFTLVHDDIMDEAPLRRGKPTVHHKYNTNTGILSGDVMLVKAYDYLLQLDATIIPKAIKVFNQVATEVCEGQQFDMNFETSDDVTLDAYLKMIELKTAALIAGALQIGAMIGGASDEDLEHLNQFGRNIGIAFQLQDDILDTFGDPAKFGKKVGGDIVQNKKTFLVIKALEVADEAIQKELRQLMNTPTTNETEKINTVTNLFNSLKVKEIAEGYKNSYLEKAYQALAAVNVSEERKSHIMALAQSFVQREV